MDFLRGLSLALSRLEVRLCECVMIGGRRRLRVVRDDDDACCMLSATTARLAQASVGLYAKPAGSYISFYVEHTLLHFLISQESSLRFLDLCVLFCFNLCLKRNKASIVCRW